MLYAFLDDSNTHASARTVTLAGYIAHKDARSVFEQSSTALFHETGITTFHARKFEKRDGIFKGWTPPKQLIFATEWLNVATANVMCGYSVTIDKAEFREAKATTRLAAEISPIGYCFKIALSKMCKNSALWQQICEHGLAIVLEDGNTNNRGMLKDFQRMLLENGPLNGRVRSLETAKKNSCCAIQLADYLAYYAGQDIETFGRSTMKRSRPMLDLALNAVPTDYSICFDFTPNPDW